MDSRGLTYPVGKEAQIMLRGLFQPWHLFVLLVIVLIIFGPGRLTELGSALGKTIRGFKKSFDDPEKKSE